MGRAVRGADIMTLQAVAAFCCRRRRLKRRTQHTDEPGIGGTMTSTTVVIKLCVARRELTRRDESASPRPADQHHEKTDREDGEPADHRAPLAANAAHRLALENRAAACSVRQRPSLASAAGNRRPGAHPTVALAHRLTFVRGPAPTVYIGTEPTPAAVRRPAADPFLVWSIVGAAIVLEVLHGHAYLAPPENA